MLKILGIGDNVCDKYRNRKIMYPGGQALNVAVYAGQLGAEAAYMGVFGDDAVAEHVMKTLGQLKIDYSHCQQHHGENGYAVVDFDHGDRYFVCSNKGGIVNQYPLVLSEDDLAYIAGFDHLHSSENGHIDDLLPVIKSTGVPLSYDFSIRWNKPGGHLDKVAPYIDFAFASCEGNEEQIMEIVRLLHRKGCKNVMVTAGKRGAVFYDGVQVFRQLPHLVEAKDTLGAGDSFAAAFLVTYTRAKAVNPEDFAAKTSDFYQNAVRQALEDAAVFSAKICMVDGAFGYGTAYDADEQEKK